VRPRTASQLASSLLILSACLGAAGVVLQIVTREVPVEYYAIRGFQAPFGVIIGATGWVIATRRHSNPIGWIFLITGVVSCLQSFDSGYVTYSVARSHGSLPLTDVFAWMSVWIWVGIVAPLSTLVLILFPEGRLETSRQRRLVMFSVIASAAFAAALSVNPGQAGEAPKGISNPFALSGSTAKPLLAIGSTLYMLAVVLSMAVLVARFRRSTGDVRQQMKWITFAASIAAVAIGVSTFLLAATGDTSGVVVRVSSILVIVGFVGIPIAAGIAVLRYGLYEIDLVISKTIVYAVLAVFITVVYVGVVVGVGALVGSEANTGLSIAATAIVALAVQPVRARANRLANRLVVGKRASPYEALSEFSARLSEGVEVEETLPRLARLMTEATSADRASVWLAVGADVRPAGVWPPGETFAAASFVDDTIDVPGADRVYPVRHEGEILGSLAVSTPASDPLTSAEERLLSDLASQAGLLLRNARLITELHSSRQRLVAAQDLERRRIERNLHDGAQQHLVALAVSLNVLGSVVGQKAPEVVEMIDQIKANATDALENLRDLARGIYPPLLADRGLFAALASQATKASLPVEVAGDGIGRYPQEAESALYFCALEALQNVAKYARATNAQVLLFSTEQTLGFEVVDDGQGFDMRSAIRGAGLTNMADRLESLGGKLQIESVIGRGTTVRGWVAAQPVTPTAPAPPVPAP
jgi:signal transduction histidine kinase